jgi:hypothetical protein
MSSTVHETLFSPLSLASRDLGSMVSIQYYVIKSDMPEFWHESVLYVQLKGMGRAWDSLNGSDVLVID